MEWAVLFAFALVAAAVIGLARPARAARDDFDDEARLVERRRVLLAELRELDEDLAAGRIDAGDRLSGRRALGPELRAATEALRQAGVVHDDPPGGAP